MSNEKSEMTPGVRGDTLASTAPDPASQGPKKTAGGQRDETLLLTKLFVPLPVPTLVDRPRLLAQLTAAVRHPVTLLLAPAG